MSFALFMQSSVGRHLLKVDVIPAVAADLAGIIREADYQAASLPELPVMFEVWRDGRCYHRACTKAASPMLASAPVI